jgi:hypothetical protein
MVFRFDRGFELSNKIDDAFLYEIDNAQGVPPGHEHLNIGRINSIPQ